MYKLLSLDGGGSWAILQLLTLKERFKDEIPSLKGREILRQFDMIIANSGGSIALAALVEDWTIDEAIRLFNDETLRKSIFSKNSYRETYWPVNLTRFFSFGPKYSSKRKGETFRKLFPKTNKVLMNELPSIIGKKDIKLIISTYDALNNRAKFFKSYALPGSIEEYVKLTQAIHGSSNAPIQYFDFPARFKAKPTDIYYELWDGALGGFNNPVVAGVIEAFKLGGSLKDLSVVSIGNGNKSMTKKEKDRFYKVRSITTKERFKKFKIWRYKYQSEFFMKTVMNQAKTILYQPPDWANYVTMMFLKSTSEKDLENRFIRLSPMIHIDDNTSDEVLDLLNDLYELDMDLISDSDIEKIRRCFNEWKNDKIKNQPISYSINRKNELKYHFGDEFYSDAMEK